jgi:DNA-directed RNA polymerase subunit RPC12/RpoP
MQKFRCIKCGKESEFEPSVTPRMIYKGYGKHKTTEDYAVTCPHCGTRNIVEVPIREQEH